MHGLLHHLRLTLLLNLKSRQALVYGYLVPFFFLIAFGSIFRNSAPPLVHQLGQLLTISVLGGACFGMPTALVSERERGLWRRYRLLPAPTSSLLLSTLIARFLIIASAALMQILLANLMYGMPLPTHPLQLLAAFSAVIFAFLGMGLVIAMLADNVPAVQALGQALFLPMIMIGGVGVPLTILPNWAQHLARFLPGLYAVHALDNATAGTLSQSAFDLLALLAIGAAAFLAASKMFRWDAAGSGEKLAPKNRKWLLLALAAWLAVGLTAELTRPLPAAPATSPAASWQSITPQDIAAVSFANLPPDDQTVTPLAPNLDQLDPEGITRLAQFRDQLAHWPPASDPDPLERTRSLLTAAAIADLEEDPYEAEIAYTLLQKLQAEIPHDDLEKILTYLIQHPSPLPNTLTLPTLNLTLQISPDPLPDRIQIYATKFLARIDHHSY